MKAQKECFTCLKRQAQVHQVDLHRCCAFLDSLPKDRNGASLELSPPQIAITLYANIAQELQKRDPFKEIKLKSIQRAYELLQSLKIENLGLQEAIKLCALGNVIDYGSASKFCIDSFDFAYELKHLDFACFDFLPFLEILQGAKTFVLLGDNAGENLFDELLLRVLKRDYPHLELFYFVRGEAIINDISLQDLQEIPQCQGIFEVTRVIDSGVRSPGFVYEDATDEAKNIFCAADLILSKGMGNFECLDEKKNHKIFYLLKIKCQVVAKSLNFSLGKMIFQQSESKI